MDGGITINKFSWIELPVVSLNVSNIVLFVGDAVRYDSIDQRLSEMGPTYKTVAASLHTPASFGTMLSGFEVPRHGVCGFNNVIPEDVETLVDLQGGNSYFSNKTGVLHEDLHRIFGTESKCALADAEPPFIWIVRDPGGHAPYGGYDGETYEYKQSEEAAQQYLHKVAGNTNRLRADYETGIDDSLSRFQEVRDTIRNRGLEKETLLIYTSDHGELLGEHGLVGHNHIACPELVYVPTTFVHPSLTSGEREGLIRHSDLAPTVVDAWNRSRGFQADGTSFEPGRNVEERHGYNHFESVFYSSRLNFHRSVYSCWSTDGGYAQTDTSWFNATMIYAGVLLQSAKGRQIIHDREFAESLKLFLPGWETHGSPSFSKNEAKEIIDDNLDERIESERIRIDEETEQRLKNLGYR